MVLPKNFKVFNLDKKITNYDLVFNALHGEFGEDGQVQSLLDNLGVKYTGSGVLASAWGINKVKTNLIAEKFGIKIPKSIYIQRGQDLKHVIKIINTSIHLPCVIKPNKTGSSVGVEIVDKENNLADILIKTLSDYKEILVQEYIIGRELTCAVLTNNKPENTKIFPVIEIKPKTKFYNYDAKYKDNTTEYICPAKLDQSLFKIIQSNSQLIHDLLGCDGLTRSDFILAKNEEVYFLEINTSPGMTSHSLCPKAAASMGIVYTEFLDMLIQTAL